MTEWDDERISLSGRRADTNIPRKISSASLRDTRLALGVLILVPVLFIVIVWWSRLR
jgi:hypothetical protein